MIDAHSKMVAFDVRPKLRDMTARHSLRHTIIAFRRRERATREFQHSFFAIYYLKEYCADTCVTRICLTNKLFFKLGRDWIGADTTIACI